MNPVESGVNGAGLISRDRENCFMDTQPNQQQDQGLQPDQGQLWLTAATEDGPAIALRWQRQERSVQGVFFHADRPLAMRSVDRTITIYRSGQERDETITQDGLTTLPCEGLVGGAAADGSLGWQPVAGQPRMWVLSLPTRATLAPDDSPIDYYDQWCESYCIDLDQGVCTYQRDRYWDLSA
jgi:hypothetical protein